MFDRKKAYKIIEICAIAVIIVGIFYNSYTANREKFTPVNVNEQELPIGKPAQICITVQDGFSDKPLKDSYVVIPELSQSFCTDAKGKTPVIDVPVNTDARFSKILPQPWGEITIIVYKDGYIPYALFHAQVLPGQVRNGPLIMLFPAKVSGNNEPFSIIEGPLKPWVNELVEKYKPKKS